MPMQMQSPSSRTPSLRPPTSEPLPASLLRELEAAARRHGFGVGAAQALWGAISLGQGSMAQFDHAEFGGSGQWMRGGMLMIGDMFNHALKARVEALCDEVERLYGAHPEWHVPSPSAAKAEREEWWPAGLHSPSTSGAQNGIRYAYFPAQRRLAIERGRAVELYDTGNHLIGSASQQQGDVESLAFASQLGPVTLSDLRRIDALAEPEAAPGNATRRPAAQEAPAGRTPPGAEHHLLDTIEKLAALHARGVLTDAEFSAKKTELLGRL